MNNLPSTQDIERLHHKYAPSDKAYALVYGHCQVVAEIALWCADNIDDKVDRSLLKTAALLHDIGSYAFFDDDTRKSFEGQLYPLHAILGARIIADEGLPQQISDIVSTHVLLGLTKQEITDKSWPLPEHDYVPRTLEAQLLCYADRFHSKLPTFNAHDSFLARLKQILPLQAQKFEAWSVRFGVPNIAELAKKYNQPIR